MRIIVVSNIYPPVVRGGYEVECSGVVDLLRDNGHEVVVLTSRVDGRAARDGHILRALHLRSDTRTAIWTSPLTTIVDRRVTERLRRSFRPDFAFVWNGAHIPHATIYDLLASGLPTAFRVCEHWFGQLYADDYYMRYLVGGGGRRRRLWSAGVRTLNIVPGLRISPSVEAEVAVSWVSEFLRGAVRMPDGLHAKVERVIHPTTRNAALFAAVERRPSEGSAVLAFVGRLSPEKGADIAIGALATLVERGIDATLVLAGSGTAEDRARLDTLAGRASMTARCSFVGRLDPDEVADLLARSTVLLVPSVWAEPLPITVTEGALARVPVVAARVGGIPEALAEGKETILTPPDDANALATGIEVVLGDEVATRARVERAYERARTRTWEAYADATLRFVEDAYDALTTGTRARIARS